MKKIINELALKSMGFFRHGDMDIGDEKAYTRAPYENAFLMNDGSIRLVFSNTQDIIGNGCDMIEAIDDAINKINIGAKHNKSILKLLKKEYLKKQEVKNERQNRKIQ